MSALTHENGSVGSVSLSLPEVSEDAAREFTRTWFRGRDGWVVLTRIPTERGILKVESVSVKARDLTSSISNDLLQGMIIDSRSNWNAYVSCSTHAENPTADSKFRRGGKTTIEQTHGTWLDLDVKDTAFSSGAECDELIRKMGVNPTLVVNSGTGGRHAYWKLTEPLPKAQGEKIGEAWLARARQISGRHIDQVSTCDRIMRLPGTVRWPKEDGESWAPVSVLYSGGAETSLDELWRWSGSAWEQWNERRRETRVAMDESVRIANTELASMLDSDGWGGLLGLAGFEDTLNTMVSWEDILSPLGWTLLGEDSEGRKQWARPGQSGRGRPEKSAHTDWHESPHVMSLFSEDPATGLSDLKEAGVTLSKMVVFGRLHFAGNTRAMVESVMRAVSAAGSKGGSQA